MTRKRRKTRSRQERARVHARTRQTWKQFLYRQVERHWASMPTGNFWARYITDKKPVPTHNRFLEPDEWVDIMVD